MEVRPDLSEVRTELDNEFPLRHRVLDRVLTAPLSHLAIELALSVASEQQLWPLTFCRTQDRGFRDGWQPHIRALRSSHSAPEQEVHPKT